MLLNMKTSNKSYQRRSGVIIRDTIADKVLLDVVDNNTESIRDLALVAAYIAKASPKFFGYLKTEMSLAEPDVNALIKTFYFAHEGIENPYFDKTNNITSSLYSQGNNKGSGPGNTPDVIEKFDTNKLSNNKEIVSLSENLNSNNPIYSKSDIMPMITQDKPTKRRGIKVVRKL